jgi:hypothetical protein
MVRSSLARWLFLLALAGTCLTADDIRRIECSVGCRREGYDAGTFAHGKCACFDYLEPEDVTGTRVVMPRMPQGRVFYAGRESSKAE